MVGEVKVDATELRFGPYVDELRDFLSRRDLPLGRAEDLQRLLQQMEGSPALEEEVASLLRAISYSEGERLGRAELMELLSVAVTGTTMEAALVGMPDVLRPLFAFVNSALRPQSFWSPNDAEEDAGPEAPGNWDTEGPLSEAVAPPFVLPEQPKVSGIATSPLQPESALPRQRAAGGSDVFLRAEQLAAAREGSQSVPVAEKTTDRSAPEQATPPRKAAEAEPSSAAPQTRSQPSTLPVPSSAPIPTPEAVSSNDDSRKGPKDSPLAQQPDAERPGSSALKSWWLIPVMAAGLAILGLGAYLARPGVSRGGEVHRAALGLQPAVEDVSAPCVPSMSSGTSRAALEERSHWAHRLLDQKLYASALPELQEIARLDAGFPGINLDESVALLHLQRLDEAQVAADAQIGITECLAHLPSTTLESYCSAQYSSTGAAGCRPQLAHLREAAQLQSALVHIEIDNWESGRSPQPALQGGVTAHHKRIAAPEHHAAPFPAATEDDNVVPPLPQSAAPAHQ